MVIHRGHQVEEAMTCWLQGLGALPALPGACPKKLLGLLPGLTLGAGDSPSGCFNGKVTPRDLDWMRWNDAKWCEMMWIKGHDVKIVKWCQCALMVEWYEMTWMISHGYPREDASWYVFIHGLCYLPLPLSGEELTSSLATPCDKTYLDKMPESMW